MNPYLGQHKRLRPLGLIAAWPVAIVDRVGHLCAHPLAHSLPITADGGGYDGYWRGMPRSSRDVIINSRSETTTKPGLTFGESLTR